MARSQAARKVARQASKRRQAGGYACKQKGNQAPNQSSMSKNMLA
ncbi:hypothetical protein N9L68_05435 [bacterium]|nr:hypothetical protein [bacterium]